MAAKLAGSGGGRYDLGQNREMNITPFVDVMLVLLIIFMVAAPMATTAIKLDLPRVQSPIGDPPPPTVVSLGSNGALYVSSGTGSLALTTLDRLGADVAASVGGPNPTREQVFIRADKGVRYGRFVAVMDRLQRDNFRKVGLISENL